MYKDYTIIRRDTFKNLITDVNRYLGRGYIPLGGVVITNGKAGFYKYNQTVVLEENNEKQKII